jgi:hypothetical protein
MRRLAPLIRSDSHLCLTDWAICLRLSVCLSAESAALKKDVLELRDLLHQAPLAVLHTFPICPDTLHFSPYPYSRVHPPRRMPSALAPINPDPQASRRSLPRARRSHANGCLPMPCRPLRRRASRRTLFTSLVRGPSLGARSPKRALYWH